MTDYFEDNVAQEGHGRRAVRSGFSSLLARAVTALGQIGSVLFLARLLTPEDYGLVAMVMAITGFAPILVDLGTRDAIVQRPRITELEVSTLFWITVGVGCLSALLISSLGPLLAWFYGEPRLRLITMVSSLTFVVASLSSQHQALLRRKIQFQRIAIVEVIASLSSSVIAVSLAFLGFGYWALVTRPIVMYCFITGGVWAICRWIPSRPAFTPSVKEMLKFGLNSTGFSIGDFIGRNCDRVAIGRGLGAKTLGYYQNALFIYENLLDILVIPLHQVAVANLSKLHDKPDDLKRAWSKGLSTIAFYASPAFGLLAVTSQELVAVVLGPKWTNAGLILSILALRGIPHSIERTLGWLHVTAGRTDRWMHWGWFAVILQLTALLCGLPFGTYGVATAYVVAMFGLFLPAIVFAGKPYKIGTRDVLNAVGPQVAGSLIAVSCAFVLRQWLPTWSDYQFPRALLIGAIYALIYCGIVVGLFKHKVGPQVIRSLFGDLVRSRLGGSVKMLG